jgi:dihydrofolate reductase
VDYPEVTILADNGTATVPALRRDTGKDIWLTGGGNLFRSVLEADLADTVELGISPILPGQGLPLLPLCGRAVRRALTHHQAFPSGLLVLHYAVERAAA